MNKTILILLLMLIVGGSISTGLITRTTPWKKIGEWLTYSGNVKINGNVSITGSYVNITIVNQSIIGDQFIFDGNSHIINPGNNNKLIFKRDDTGVADTNILGKIQWETIDNSCTATTEVGYIQMVADSGFNQVNPEGRIEWGTSAGGGGAAATKMFLTKLGYLVVGEGLPTPAKVDSDKVFYVSDVLGSEVILGTPASTNVGTFIGGLAFRNDDTSGTPPHYAGIKAFGADNSGRMSLGFYVSRNNYEADIPQVVIDGVTFNFGILNETPDHTLSVNGEIYAKDNITAENVFLPQEIFTHTNKTIIITGANEWTNITFTQEATEIMRGISHTHNDTTNHTFTFGANGRYDIDYDFDTEDTSPSASDIDVAGRVIYKNGTEVKGSVFETDITKQGVETEVHTTF